MSGFQITKQYVKLTEDHMHEGCFHYPEENGFISTETEGVIIDCHSIGLIPNISEKKYSEIVLREMMAKQNACYLVLINGRLVTISVSKLDIFRYEPPGPIFEDDEDREQYLNAQIESMKRQAKEAKNAST